MKNTILHWTSVLLAGSALLFAACSSDDDSNDGSKTTPVFPNLETLTIPAGENSCDISFTPNMDWTVSIPTDAETAKWFELRDGDMPTSSISGKASLTPVTVTLVTVDQDLFDETPVCEVSLTMGGQTQVIAKVTRGNALRTFELYASNYNTEEDDFIIPYIFSETALTKYTGSETEFPYEEAPEGTVELKWPIRVGNHMYVFKTTSNFNWLVSAPEWLEITQTAIEGEENAYQITITGKFTEANIDGAAGVIDFYDANIDKTEDPGNNAHNKYCISIPSGKNIVRHPYANINATFSFNADGQYVSQSLGGDETVSDNLSTSVSSTKGLKFFVLKPDGYGGYYAAKEETSWVTVTDTWDENGEVFQQHSYTVDVEANTGNAARSAALLAIPESLATNIDENGDLDAQLLKDVSFEVKDEYKPYLFATIEQESANSGSGGGDGFSISEGESNQMYQQFGYYTFEDLTNGDPYADEDIANNWDVIDAGGKLYRLTYSSFDLMGSISFLLNGEYANVMTASAGDWLGVELYDNQMYVTMDVPGNTYTSGQGFIRIYDSNYTQLACIICIRKF